MKTLPSPSMTIGALARASGVGIDAIRFYEREGLLPRPARRASGYRDYPLDTVRRLRFIRRAKALGFSLEEIGELLALSSDHEHGVEGIRQRAATRLRMIDERIAELQRVRQGLQALVGQCPGEGSPDCCPILQALGDEDSAPAPLSSSLPERPSR